jgi:hypothetical protein
MAAAPVIPSRYVPYIEGKIPMDAGVPVRPETLRSVLEDERYGDGWRVDDQFMPGRVFVRKFVSGEGYSVFYDADSLDGAPDRVNVFNGVDRHGVTHSVEFDYLTGKAKGGTGTDVGGQMLAGSF